MWPKDFASRLDSWQQLRAKCKDLPLLEAITAINQWWQMTPWQPYYLHWDDFANWPDPWLLLSDNTFCGLARCLGIMYTISLLERDDLSDAEMIMTVEGLYLVTVNNNSYLLNWSPEILVNTDSEMKTKKRLTLDEVKEKYK
jgi:hypothetical protein